MVKVLILGQGYVGSIFAVGVERIKRGEIEHHGVPLADELSIKVSDIEIVGSYDVDKDKVGRNLEEVVRKYWKDEFE